MQFEYRLPLCDPQWKPLKANTSMEAAKEVVGMRDLCDVQVRDADTKKHIELLAPYGYNGGRMCDTPPGGGPCCCGAWH